MYLRHALIFHESQDSTFIGTCDLIKLNEYRIQKGLNDHNKRSFNKKILEIKKFLLDFGKFLQNNTELF